MNGGYQVLIERDGESVSAQDRANVAVILSGIGQLSEAVDAEFGLWLVDLTSEAEETLVSAGYLEVAQGCYTLMAEMP